MPASKDTGMRISEPSGVIEHAVYMMWVLDFILRRGLSRLVQDGLKLEHCLCRQLLWDPYTLPEPVQAKVGLFSHKLAAFSLEPAQSLALPSLSSFFLF